MDNPDAIELRLRELQAMVQTAGSLSAEELHLLEIHLADEAEQTKSLEERDVLRFALAIMQDFRRPSD